MKICIYGAGAIGGYLGAELVLAGYEVTLIARGPHLEAIRGSGLTLLKEGEREIVQVACTHDPAEAGPHDYVVMAVKAHSVTAIVEKMVPLLGPETAVVTAQNGIPWWYFHKLEGSWEGRRLESADPGGRIWEVLGPDRAIGCVVYPSCQIVEPGVIQHIQGNRFMLGEPDGSKSERVVALSKALTASGLKAPVRPRIRDDIWLKLWGNVSFNPVSVLTLATLEQITADEGVREVIRDMMREAQAVASALGVKFSVDVNKRIGWAGDVGAHKTSMLQDLETGRPMEIDALVATVSEMGRLVEVPTPTIDVVLALVRLRAQGG
ncbi:2-dehydropantoate 2-reductase [Acidobacteria bacterium AH-259-D05]|nr:2-dehydropantoate 2-reductase [Acidobacteria bacterium AH-259-D05]